MNNSAWLAFLDTLTPEHRALAQKIMDRIQTVMNSDRSKTFDDIQRGERRADGNAKKIDELHLRLDAATQVIYDELSALSDQLPPPEVLFNLSARIEALEKEKQAGDAGS